MNKFLVEMYGCEQGRELYRRQKARLESLLPYTRSLTKGQIRTLAKIILPRIALYQVLIDAPDSKDDALSVMAVYMERVGAKMGKVARRLEIAPLFYYLFRKIFAYVAVHSDNWVVDVVKNNRESVEINITKCLWYEACADNGCPELCKCFCGTDDIIYGSLRKIKFSRTNTIGCGGEWCDFRYANSKFIVEK
jgi:hypothetical protein